jgi:hypothetical protein
MYQQRVSVWALCFVHDRNLVQGSDHFDSDLYPTFLFNSDLDKDPAIDSITTSTGSSAVIFSFHQLGLFRQ